MDILDLSIQDLSSELGAGNLSSVEVTKAYLDAIEKDRARSDSLNAYISVFNEEALRSADASDQLIASGNSTPLTGIPLAIKDNINIKGMPTTCGSRILEGYTATYDAFVTESLIRKNGMIPLGKTNMDEFAMGSSSETSGYGIIRNPFDRNKIPGGSSGGSAASVAGRLAPVSIGSDTGGSIRQPASLCGVVGLKPTYGLVSRYGLIAFASSLDQIGPISRTVDDSLIMLKALCGHDPKDSTSLETSLPDGILDGNIRGKIIGIPDEYFVSGLDPEVEACMKKVIRHLESSGAEILHVSLPHSEYAIPIYYILATAEASSNLERFDGVKYGFRAPGKNLSDLYLQSRSRGFGEEVKRRIMLGTYVLSAGYYDAYYLKALKIRNIIRTDFENAFKKADYILSPTSPTPAFNIGEKSGDPVSMYLSDIYTVSVNLAGLPAVSVPAGRSGSGLPIGAQVIGRLLDDRGVLNCAKAIEFLNPPHSAGSQPS